MNLRVLVLGDEEGSWVVSSLAEAQTRTFEATHDPGVADVAVFLVSRADPDPLAALAEIAEAHDPLPVVAIGDRADEDFAFEALAAGASAYLARSEAGSRLLTTTIVGAVQHRRAVVHLRRAQEQVLHLATHDPVTRLGNRSLFMDRMAQAVALAERQGRQLAVLVLDLSGLRPINETLGHDAGDRLLRETAERIAVRASDAVAHSDPTAAPIARLGGNEFTILLTDINEAQGAARVARRVLQGFAEPFVIDGRETYAQASVGVAVFPSDGRDADSMVRNAHTAMHIAKREGPDHFRFFAESMNEEAARRLLLASHLHGVLDRRELSVYYQPVRNAESGRLVAAEALLRWSSPELGNVSPAEFIPIAEDAGLIVPIGEWVLATACAQVESWRRARLRPIRLAVNLSLHQARGGQLADTVMRVLRDTGLSADQLELEITETAFVQNEHTAVEMVREIRDRGVGLALDDFGTGYSGLTHLRRFPIDRLKLDNTFTSQIAQCADDAALAAAVIAMAHSLRLRVVAEGVETQEQATLLREQKCDELQGFLFSPAVPANEFVRFMEADKKNA